MEEGRNLLEQIQKETGENMLKMRSASGKQWSNLCDRNYELRSARRKVQSEMTKIFEANRSLKNAN